MDLNNQEREQVTAAVAAIHSKWRTRVFNCDCVVGLSFLAVTAFAIIAIIRRIVLAQAVASWWQFIALIGLLVVINGFYFWRAWKLKKLLDQNRVEQWLREIDQIEVSDQDRQLFLLLIVSLYEGPTEGFLETVAEALKSPVLSRLTFLCEIRTYLRVK